MAKIDAERQERKRKEALKKRFNEYWSEHTTEKEHYEKRIHAIDSEIKSLREAASQYDTRISEIRKALNQSVPTESQLAEIRGQIKTLSDQKAGLGIFAGKQKKQLQEQIDTLQLQVATYEESIRQQKKAIESEVADRVAAVETERKPLLDQIATLETEKKSINYELTRER